MIFLGKHYQLHYLTAIQKGKKSEYVLVHSVEIIYYGYNEVPLIYSSTPLIGCSDGDLVYGVSCHFQQYFSYIVAVRFIGRGNRSTRGKPLTCRKLLTNFIT